ncbi:MAG: PspA/IM30 family protein [Gemmatimonadota bacterium]|jgi:phage shock protein A
MGIFTKLSTLIKSNINDLINRAENPEKMLNQIILDMRDQLAKAKREVAAAIADERKLRSQLEDEVKQAKEWEQRAMLAVNEGRDDLAKQALVRHEEHTQRAKALDQTWRAQAQETEKLKASLRQLNDKIDEAKRKRNLLIAKQKRAQAQKRIHETMSGLSDTSAFEAFNRMAEKIEESERRSVAAAEVNEALVGDTLETEFTRLEAGSGAVGMDDRLLALKQQMGLLAGSADEPKKLEAGDDDEAGTADASASGDARDDSVRDAEVEDDHGEKGGDEVIAEAELLERFKEMEKNAEA